MLVRASSSRPLLFSAQPLDDTAFASGEGVTLYPPEGADAYQAQGAAVGTEEGGACAALGGAGAADADDGADGRGVAGYDERGVWVDPSEPQWMASDRRCFYMPAQRVMSCLRCAAGEYNVLFPLQAEARERAANDRRLEQQELTNTWTRRACVDLSIFRTRTLRVQCSARACVVAKSSPTRGRGATNGTMAHVPRQEDKDGLTDD